MEYLVNVLEDRVEWNRVEWRNLNGELHREDGPAVEWENGDKYWCINGKYHREDGPAIEWADGVKEWWVNGEQYTEEEFNKLKEGVQLHREDGPEIKYAEKEEVQFIELNGKKYRLVPVEE